LHEARFRQVFRGQPRPCDYGVEGARLTTKYLAEAGLVQAGVGESLREAREAKFLDTEKGRVALISVASTFPDPTRAGVSWGDTRARPGLNPLRFTTTQIVTREQFDALRGALTSAGIGTGRGQNGEDGRQRAADGSATAMTLANRRIVAGEKTGTHTEPLKEDVD